MGCFDGLGWVVVGEGWRAAEVGRGATVDYR